MTMKPAPEAGSRSESKRQAIVAAATRLFMDRGYDGASMDDVAELARVSKPTVYKHFSDKERLYAEIVQATADRVDGLVQMVADTLAKADDVEGALRDLGRAFMSAILQPETIRLRRLVISTADRFPEVGRGWYEQGFERVLTTLAKAFKALARRGALKIANADFAAQHFVGLLLWIPVNKAMFTGSLRLRKSDIDTYVREAVRVFLHGYSAK